MEDWLGLAFRSLLAKYVSNFSKDQLSVSLLKGKGHMHDVILDVAEINALPAVQASPVRVRRRQCVPCMIHGRSVRLDNIHTHPIPTH